MNKLDLEETTRRFHNVYEQVAKEYGYKTREDTKELDFNSPNGMTMLKTVEMIMAPYLDEIERLNEELKQAKEIALNDHKYASKMEDKYITANNIINELDKWLEVNLTNLEKEETSNIYNEGLKQGMLSNGRLIKDKLQELKGSVSNEL